MYLELAGQRALAAHVVMPAAGVWVAAVDFDDAVQLAGKGTLQIGALALVGTVDLDQSGAHLAKARVTLVGGAHGWAQRVTAKHWHSDAGVRASAVATITAQDVGETVEGVPADSVGADFVRRAAPAARVMDTLFPASWRVDADGITRVGAPSDTEISQGYQVLDFDPRSRVATLAVDEPSSVVRGAIVRDALGSPRRIRSLELLVTQEAARVYALTEAAA